MTVSLAQTAKQKMPSSPATSDILGWAYYKLGSPESAITQMKEAVKGAPHIAAFQYHLGMAYLAAGRSHLAVPCLQQALSSDPGFQDAANARAALEQASKLRDLPQSND